MSNIVKKDESPPLFITGGKLRSTSSPFQRRISEAKASIPEAKAMPNRLCLMLDRSSSMCQYVAVGSGKNDKSKIELLKEAIDNFVNRCDFTNTSLAVETFPASLELALTSVPVLITTSVATLTASGSTPIRSCVQGSLEKIPMTRGIIVSDGEATDWYNRDELRQDDESLSGGTNDPVLQLYKKANIPIDCVHIGDSSSGEELLRRIAKETGGVYLKFSDVNSFSKGFSYLTPGYRAMLTDGRVTASELGANEVRR